MEASLQNRPLQCIGEAAGLCLPVGTVEEQYMCSAAGRAQPRARSRMRMTDGQEGLEQRFTPEQSAGLAGSTQPHSGCGGAGAGPRAC